MTNVDFFDAFCLDTTTKSNAYYFEHDTPKQEFQKLFDSAPEDTRVFHWTRSVKPVINDSGHTEGVEYKGMLVIGREDPKKADGVPYNQKGQDKAKGKYTLYVKSFIEDGGVFKEIEQYNRRNNTSDNHQITWGDGFEVYNMGTAQGLKQNYTMFISAKV